MKKLSYVFLILSNLVYAKPFNVNNLPADLQYFNKPIDPLCFFQFENNKKHISLSLCSVEHKNYSINEYNDFFKKQGYIGYDWKDSTTSYPSGGYSYYKAYNAGKNAYWIYTVNNGGGSGDFTAINYVQRKDSKTLKIINIAGGDRCNGGIRSVKDSDSFLKFQVNLTAYDLLALANESPPLLKAYDDLAACAVCCVAEANYQIDSNLKSRLNSIDINSFKKSDDLPEQGQYQTCFNDLIMNYSKKSKGHLNIQQLKALVKEFDTTCVK